MNKLHIRYFLIAVTVTSIAALAVAGFIISLFSAATGAAFIAGWWTNLAAAGTVGILGGRKAALAYTDPRVGKVAGAAIGFWVGVGAIIGQVILSIAVAQWFRGDVRSGLVAVFSVVSFIISLIAGMIAGRETAHPPEEEEA